LLSKVVFALLLAVIFITAIPYGTVEPWWKALFVCVVFGICILSVIEIAINTSLRFNPGPTVLPLLALSALALLQTATGISADNFQTRFFALQLLALTLFLALLYRYAASENRLRTLVYLIIIVAIISALFGILRQTTQHQIGFILPLLKPNQGFAQFINKNHFAYLIEMAFGLTIALLIVERSTQKLIYVALLLPLWVGLGLSNSRGGILAMLTQVVIATLLLVKRAALRVALAAALVIGVLVGTLWIGGDRLATNLEAARTELTNPTEPQDGANRKEIWRATLKMFAAHPLLGAGLGGYWIGITAYHDASGALTPQEAHNDYLELLASGGVIAFALGVWFAVNVIRLARKNLWSNHSGFIHAARLGAVLGIAGVAVHSLVDFGLHLVGNAVVFLTLVMIATAQIEPQKSVAVNVSEQ
jgi:O-antigen ligase